MNAVNEIKTNFPNKIIKTFELRKSNSSPKDNALHLDCCFQPIGKDKAIIYPGGFLIKDEYDWLVNFFGKENIFETTKEEMYNMNCNVFSISENVIVSENNLDLAQITGTGSDGRITRKDVEAYMASGNVAKKQSIDTAVQKEVKQKETPKATTGVSTSDLCFESGEGDRLIIFAAAIIRV